MIEEDYKTHLPTPAVPNSPKLGNLRKLLLNSLNRLRGSSLILPKLRGSREKRPVALLLLGRVGRVVVLAEGLVVEPVRHEDLVLVFLVARVGEDVGALDGLGPEAEDVEDEEDGRGGCFGACVVWFSGRYRERGSAMCTVRRVWLVELVDEGCLQVL